MAVEELMTQLQGEFPDWIVFASSSGGTQAGLLAGALYYGVSSKILGISVDEPAPVLTARIVDLANEVVELLGKSFSFVPEDILVNDDYIGEGYGVMGDLERNAIKEFARREGILLDPVYTGRAGGGLLDLIQKGFFTPEESVLFWHTGGTPGLFADKYRADIL
jgi:D-cysteine desulfhydrase